MTLMSIKYLFLKKSHIHKKYFIGYNDNYVNRPLCIKLQQMTGYVIKFEGNATEISNKQLLKKYNEIWKRVEKLLKVKFDSKPVCDDNDKYIKAKIKIYAGTMITNFHSKKFQNKKRDASVYQ